MYLLFLPFIAQGQTQPRFYYCFSAEFSDLPPNKSINNKKIEIRVEELYKKFRKANLDNVLIPDNFFKSASYKILPRLNEKLWAFHDSKLVGIIHANQYFVTYSEMDDSKSLGFSVKNPGLYLYPSIFVSVPPNTEMENLPMENQCGILSAQEEKNLLKIMDDEAQDYSVINDEKRTIKRIDDDYYATPVFTSIPTATPTATETPTITPTPTFKDKTNALLKGIFLTINHAPSSTPTPSIVDLSAIFVPTAIKIFFTPTPTTTIEPFSWSRNGLIAKAINFKKEKVAIITAKAVLKYHRRGVFNEQSVIISDSVCSVNGKFFDLKRLLPVVRDDSRLYIVQTFKVLGKNYIVLGSYGVTIVCRIDISSIKPVSVFYENTDE